MAYEPSGSPIREKTRRHYDYYLNGGDMIFYVEDTFFNVHRYFFERESQYFARAFSEATPTGHIPRGSSESNPFPLDDVSALDFTRFLWVFYNPTYSLYDNATIDEWISILKLSELWGFARVKELAVRHIEMQQLDPVGRIELYNMYRVERRLLVPSYTALALRPEPISLEEGMRLGLETAIGVTRARELARGRDGPTGRLSSPVQAKEDELSRVVRETFFAPPPNSPLHVNTNGTAVTPGIHSVLSPATSVPAPKVNGIHAVHG